MTYTSCEGEEEKGNKLRKYQTYELKQTLAQEKEIKVPVPEVSSIHFLVHVVELLCTPLPSQPDTRSWDRRAGSLSGV